MKWLPVILVCLTLSALLPPSLPVEGSAASTLSASRMGRDFAASGRTLANDTINVTSLGGDLVVNGVGIHFVPYYSMYWSIGDWLFFLVNVTGRDFYSAYLYLDNNTHVFGLYVFHYATGDFKYLAFQGEEQVSASIVDYARVMIPSVSIQPEAKFSNVLYASGLSLQIAGNAGIMNGARIYSLLNLYNITVGGSSWNELWILRTTQVGLYFGILYMFNDSHRTVVYAYDLKLSDLTLNYAQKPLALTASWRLGTPQPLTTSYSFSSSAMTPILLLLSVLTTGFTVSFLLRKKEPYDR